MTHYVQKAFFCLIYQRFWCIIYFENKGNFLFTDDSLMEWNREPRHEIIFQRFIYGANRFQFCRLDNIITKRSLCDREGCFLLLSCLFLFWAYLLLCPCLFQFSVCLIFMSRKYVCSTYKKRLTATTTYIFTFYT